MGVIIRQGFKASITNYIGMVLGFLSLFLLFPLFYEPKQVGAIRLFLELGTVLSSFALLGTHYSINRFFPSFKTSDQKHHGFFFWAFIFPFTGFLLLLSVLAIGGNDIFLFLNKDALKYKELFPMLLVLVFIILYQVITEVSCANHGRIAVPNFMKEVIMRSLIILAGFAYYAGIVNFNQSVWLIVMAYFIALAGNFWFLNKLTLINLKPDLQFLKSNKILKKEALQFSILLFFSGLASLIYTKMDFFMISVLQQDLSKVAIYSIGFYLATFIDIPKRTILQIAVPIISSYMKEEKYKEVESLNKKNGTNQLLISGILFFLIWLNIDNLYEVMPRGEFYSQGKWVVFFIGIGKLIDAVVCGNGPILVNSKHYSLIFINTVIAIISSIGFNYFFISRYGIIGGAISTILVMLSINIFNFLAVQFKLKINPFETAQLRILLILSVFISLSFTPHWLSNPFIDSAVRTLVFGSAMFYAIYKLKLSEDFNQLLKSKLPFLSKLS